MCSSKTLPTCACTRSLQCLYFLSELYPLYSWTSASEVFDQIEKNILLARHATRCLSNFDNDVLLYE